MIQSLWEILVTPQKVKLLPYDPVIPLSDTYPKELKIGIQTNICTCMFTTTRIGKSTETEHRLVVVRLGDGRPGFNCLMSTGFLFWGEHVLELDGGGGCTL